MKAVVEVFAYRNLLGNLAVRDLKVRYRQSMLGLAWVALQPVVMTVVFVLVFARFVELPGSTGGRLPYALFALAGLLPWTFFSQTLSHSMNSLVSNRNLVTKVYFPREVFPLSCIVGALADFLVSSVVMGCVIGYFHLSGRHEANLSGNLLFLPIILGSIVLLTAGIGFFLAAGNVFYRDVRQVFAVAIQLLMFGSGVVVPIPTGGSFSAKLLAANPLAIFIDAFRACLLYDEIPNASLLPVASALSLLLFVSGWMAFRICSHRFAEII